MEVVKWSQLDDLLECFFICVITVHFNTHYIFLDKVGAVRVFVVEKAHTKKLLSFESIKKKTQTAFPLSPSLDESIPRTT